MCSSVPSEAAAMFFQYCNLNDQHEVRRDFPGSSEECPDVSTVSGETGPAECFRFLCAGDQRAVGVATSPALALVTPYITDANTIHLFHLNEAAGGTVAANVGSAATNAITFDGAAYAGDGVDQAKPDDAARFDRVRRLWQCREYQCDDRRPGRRLQRAAARFVSTTAIR